MATKTVTIDANEWVYPDVDGAPHTVTAAQTFTFDLADGGIAAVYYALDEAEEVNCDDGGEVQLIRDTNKANVTRAIGPLADANDGVKTYGVEGRWLMSYNDGQVQEWVPAELTINNIDAPTSITAKFEDQFGNIFTWTTVTVA